MLRNTVIATLMACWAMPAGAGVNCAAPGKQIFRFVWQASKDNPTVGNWQIKDAASGRTVQVLRNVTSYREGEWPPEVRDYNNDGCGDLKIVADVAGIGNESSDVLLYDRSRRRFVHNEILSGIGGLALDPRDPNCVNGSWKSGAASFYSARHCWRQGKLRLVQEETIDPLVEDEAVKCYQHVVHTYSRGRKRTSTTCTKEM